VNVTAIDVAILTPPEIAARAIALSAALPAAESQGLRLGPAHLPHVTLLQQFVRIEDLDAVIDRVDALLRGLAPFRLHVSGGGRGSSSVWMAVERTAPLVDLHERLMDATEAFDVEDGNAAAFYAADARDRDVQWVREFRRESSFAKFTPHITLGHASAPPEVEPMDFVATSVAVCHLGRFCTCRHVIRAWDLRLPDPPAC
jgi:2'-5' RNA ligase